MRQTESPTKNATFSSANRPDDKEKDDFKTNLISSIIILVWQIPPNRLWLPRIEVQFFETNVIAQIELRLNKLPSSYDFYS